MQVKKEEIRERILQAATDEFLKRGYEDASMRVIAKKSYTTLGNVYRYYQSKEALLEEILMPTIDRLELMLAKHISDDEENPMTKQQALEFIERLDEEFEKTDLVCFLDKRVIILLRLNSTDLLKRKEQIIHALKEHLNKHFNVDASEHYSDIWINMFIECIKYILIEYNDSDDAKAEFVKFFKIVFSGIVVGQMK